MADATGPISTLPGSEHRVPTGMMCDDHPDRPATHRVQGETDSFGSEMFDMCEECYQAYLVQSAEPEEMQCEWCHATTLDCKPTRDIDEGMAGPVYYVCGACRQRQREGLEAEFREAGEPDNLGNWEDDLPAEPELEEEKTPQEDNIAYIIGRTADAMKLIDEITMAYTADGKGNLVALMPYCTVIRRLDLFPIIQYQLIDTDGVVLVESQKIADITSAILRRWW